MSASVGRNLNALRRNGPESDGPSPLASSVVTDTSTTDAQARYDVLRAAELSLDMTRGNPSPAQLTLSDPMLTIIGPDDVRTASGLDARNYGNLDGLPEAKAIFGPWLGVDPEDVVLGENSSLALMHDTLMFATLFGVPGGTAPWGEAPTRWLCPVPGYDRHFRVTERLGFDMVSIPNLDDGLDLDAIARAAADDESVKGMWVVPKHNNPQGWTLSDDAVTFLASMKTAANDFRIIWDDAYAVHDFRSDAPQLASFLDACRSAGNEDRAWIYGSSSKVTFAGGGLAAFAGSPTNREWLLEHRFAQTIGPDKLNQLRHVAFLGDFDGVKRHMAKHAEIVRPKFDAVERVLQANLGGTDLASWTRPTGGYFVSLDVLRGSAVRVVELAAAAGVKLTPAGATSPYGRDPSDRNLRIAPTFPSLEAIEQATEVLALSVILASR